MNINPENKSKDDDNYNDLDDNDSALINYGKKSLKKQIFDKSQELLDIDTKDVSTNNSFNFGKILLGL